MRKVAILAHSDIALFELGCATELFALQRPDIRQWYVTEVISLERGPFSAIAGLQLNCQSVSSLDGFDTLVVPSWPLQRSDITERVARPIIDFVERGGRILSFCSGAFLLGYLGLLDGREATTHWRYEADFKAAFPLSDYQSNVLYVLDGNLGCSAGSAAAIDLGLAVIRQDFGNEASNKVARRLVLSGHRKGGQAQYVETPVSKRPNRLTDSMDWALERLDEAFSINEWAQQALMSRRNFDRLFRKQIGLSPQEWLISQRVVLACRLLETSRGTIENLASQSGFSNASNLRHHFQKQLGVSPRQYRDNFCH